MYVISLLLLVLSVLMDEISITSSQFTSQQCTYKFKPKHFDFKNVSYELPHCSSADIPNDVHYTVDFSKSSGYFLSTTLKLGTLHVKFTPPTRQCRYTVSLLNNLWLNDEKECAGYTFNKTRKVPMKQVTNNIICHYMSNVYNETFIKYENEIELQFNYISPGCYALQFSNVDNNVYIIGKHFVRFKIQHERKPVATCNEEVSNGRTHNFLVEFVLPSDAGSDDYLDFGVYLAQNQSLSVDGCNWPKNVNLLPQWRVNLNINPTDIRKDQFCEVRLEKHTYEKIVRCAFQYITSKHANYCLFYSLFGDLCSTGTLLRSPESVDNTHQKGALYTCAWISACQRTD